MTELQKYFEHSNDYIWMWEKDEISSVHHELILAIPDSFTIIYLHELVSLLEFLSPQGLPNLGSLLLTVIAANNNSSTALQTIGVQIRKLIDLFPKDVRNKNEVEEGMMFLQKVSQLPEKYKTNEYRRLIFQAIFRDCHNKLSAQRTKALLRELEKNKHRINEYVAPFEFDPQILKRDFKILAILNRRFIDTEAILYALTAMPDNDFVNEYWDNEVLEDGETQTNNLVDQLIQNPKTYKIGSLIKRIWGGLRIPFHQQIPGGQPLGGISDITNKGDFDRLLLSEFAHDNDVFLSRIANHEALFIQREIPPQQDKITRYLLIDITLKNWGTPKIVAYALSLAIAKHPKNEMACRYFVLGNEYKEVNLEDLDNVVATFKLLSSKLEVANALHSFFSEILPDKNAEIFILTSASAIQSTVNQQAIQEHRNQINYLFSIEIDGRINLYRYGSRSRGLLQTIQLPLEDLWANPPAKMPKLKPKNEQSNFTDIPILLPLQKEYTNIFISYDYYYIYRKGGLYLFAENTPDKGFIKLLDGLDFTFGEFTILQANQDKYLAFLNLEQDTISYYSFSTKTVRQSRLKGLSLVTAKATFLVHDSSIFLTDKVRVWQVMDDGQVIPIQKPDSYLKMYEKQDLKLQTFKSYYKRYKNNYSVITRLDKVSTDYDDLYFNGFAMSSDRFYKQRFDYEDENSLTRVENLYLKRIEKHTIGVLKILKEELNIGLGDAKSLIDQLPQLLLSNVETKVAERLKTILEDSGAVCYTESTRFISEDGSTITLTDGILIFESSNQKTPKFYIPFILNQKLAFATKNEFAGNQYFLPSDSKMTIIEKEDFFIKYVNPFIDEILKNATKT